MGGADKKSAPVMLAVNFQKQFAHVAQHADRYGLVIDEAASAPVRALHATQDDLIIIRRQTVFFKKAPDRMIGADGSNVADTTPCLAPWRTAPRSGAPADRKAQRVQQGLTCPPRSHR